MGDRTPATGPARLDERDLAVIEQRARWHYFNPATEMPYPRKAAEGDVLALVAEVRRLRTALEHYADEENWSQDPRYPRFADYYEGLDNGYDVARAALAAPGAGEGGEA